MRIMITVGTLWLMAACAIAGEASDSIAAEVRNVGEVEVTALRISRDLRSSRPLQTMDADELRLFDIRNLGDAVKRLAGVSVQDYGGLGGLKTVSVRNLGAHHTVVSYDGVAVGNTQAGQIDVGRFATDNLRSIALAVGETDDIMRPARLAASAAVLDIQTELPEFGKHRNTAYSMSVRGGSWGLVSPSLRYGQRLCGNTTLTVDASYMRADGIYKYTLPNLGETIRGRRSNSDIASWRGEANLRTLFADSSRLAAKLHWYSSRRGLPGSVVYYNDVANERLADEELFAQAVYERCLGKKWRLAARVKYAHTWNRYTDRNVKYANGIKTEINRQDEYYASATLGWFPVRNVSLSLAQDMFVNTLNTRADNAADPVRTTSLTSLSARWMADRLEANAVLTGTFATERVAAGSAPANRRRVSPSLSLSYRLLSNHALYARVMAKHTFRVPTFNDMYYDRVGTSSLRPERACEYNVGMTWTSRPWGMLRYVSVAVDAYHNDVRDKIVAFPTLYVWKMANFGKVRIDGVSMSLGAELVPADGVAVEARGSYMLQCSVDVTDRRTEYYKNQLPYTPRHSGSVSLTVCTPWVNVGYTMVAASERYSMVQTVREYRIGGYCDQSVTLSRNIRLAGCRIDLRASVRNIADECYEVVQYYPMPGRAFELSAKVDF